jgi:lactate permease
VLLVKKDELEKLAGVKHYRKRNKTKSYLSSHYKKLTAFGSFIAGSATVSNLLFTDLHILINQGNEVSLSLILALQLTGASVGNIIALTNIVSAQSIVGIKGREVAIITKSFPAFFIYLSLIILIAYLINIIT